jgi:hypothetical protein
MKGYISTEHNRPYLVGNPTTAENGMGGKQRQIIGLLGHRLFPRPTRGTWHGPFF